MLKAPKNPLSMRILALNTQCYTQAYYFVTSTHSFFHTHFHIPTLSLLNAFSLSLWFFPPFLFFKILKLNGGLPPSYKNNNSTIIFY